MDFVSKSYDFKLGDEPVSIVEIGVNHNGDIDLAKKMIRETAAAGGHIVKFQAFIASEEISKYAEKTSYQKQTTGEDANQLEMATALELGNRQMWDVYNYSREQGMPFLCTAFESKSLKFLIDDLQVKAIKVASSEVTNHPFLKEIAETGAGVILSTGASTLEESAAAVRVLQQSGCEELVVLHCVSEYPARMDEINLRAMHTMRAAFDLPIGYSDHTNGIYAPIIASAMGACAVEKHFTMDREMEGPDHRASIEPNELAMMVQGMKAAHVAQGNGVKVPVNCEIPQIPLIRKSIVVRRNMKVGEVLKLEDLAFKRPLNGIEPFDLDRVLGRALKVDLEEDQAIKWENI